MDRPVLTVTDEATGELVYAIRLTESSVRPWVFSEGAYTVRLGEPDTGVWRTWKHVTPSP